MAITVVPSETADPRATIDACRIEITAADFARPPDNTGGQFDQYITATGPSGQVLKSHVFVPSKDGEHVWLSLVFDEAGNWDIALHDNENDSEIDSITQAVQ